MKKNILLSMLVALSLSSSLSAFEFSNLDYSGKVGFVGNTSQSSELATSAFRNEDSYMSGYVGLSAKGDITDELSVEFGLVGIDSLGAKNSFQTGNKNDAVLTKANLKYKVGDNLILAGRTTFDSPLMYSDTFFPAQNSYDMLSITNSSLNNTYLYSGIVLRENNVNDLSFFDVNNPKDKFAPLLVLGGLFTGIKEFPVQAWGYLQDSGVADFTISTESKFTVDLNLALQYAFVSNNGIPDDKAVSMFGAKFLYDVNEFWSVDIAFNKVSSGSEWNSVTNRNNEKTSKLYTSLRSTGQVFGFDEASVNNTSSFMVKAKGDLEVGNVELALGLYHHIDGITYNTLNNSTHVFEFNWNEKIFDNVDLTATYSYETFEIENPTTPNVSDRKNVNYFGLSANYSF